MGKIRLYLFLSLPLLSFGQKSEYVYKNPLDSSYNCYLKEIPESGPIRGLVIRDYSSLPDTSASPSRFTTLCTEAGMMTVFTVTSKTFPELFVADSTMALLDDIVAEVVQEYKVPEKNIFIGGISASGTRALRYTQYCEQGKSRNGIRINGVFAVDSPLDLARFYYSVHRHKNYFKEGMLWEAEHMPGVFAELFSGPPDQFKEEYIKASVFSHDDSLGGNARYLKNVDVIIYHEPDIDWWLNERGASYFDINSYDIAAFVLALRTLGNEHITLRTTTGKGFDRSGNRNCHSWTIVNEPELAEWILHQLE